MSDAFSFQISSAVDYFNLAGDKGLFTARDTPFASFEWISAWCNAVGQSSNPLVVTILKGAEPVALCFGCSHRTTQAKLFGFNTFSFLETGEPLLDLFAPEYDPVIHRADSEVVDSEINCISEIVSYLFEKQGIERIRFSGIEGNLLQALQSSQQTNHFLLDMRRSEQTFWVEIERFNNTDTSYLSLLSANTRSNIKRALKKVGPCSVHKAETVEQAFRYLDELERLHQMRWQTRGQPGAFGLPLFKELLRSLIVSQLSSGFIQLLKIEGSEYPLGYLLNFTLGGTVFNYQSGVDYRDPRAHPGLVVHTKAIEYAARLGYKRYDFLAGTSQYKRSLSTNEQPLFWLDVFRRSPRSRLLLSAKNLRCTLFKIPKHSA